MYFSYAPRVDCRLASRKSTREAAERIVKTYLSEVRAAGTFPARRG